jgi:hypothetical protein
MEYVHFKMHATPIVPVRHAIIMNIFRHQNVFCVRVYLIATAAIYPILNYVSFVIKDTISTQRLRPV